MLVGESRAYGFTLLVAGTTMLLLQHHGLPRTYDIFLYPIGSLAAILFTTMFSFRPLWKPVRLGLDVRILPWGLIHVVSVLGGLGAAYLAVRFLPKNFAYVTAAFGGTLVYNLLLALESQIASADEEKASGEQ